jgi:hypothetical protein
LTLDGSTGAILKTFKAKAKNLGESNEDPDDKEALDVIEESPAKIILGTSNKNFIPEEKTFMGLNLRGRKASMPVFQVRESSKILTDSTKIGIF